MSNAATTATLARATRLALLLVTACSSASTDSAADTTATAPSTGTTGEPTTSSSSTTSDPTTTAPTTSSETTGTSTTDTSTTTPTPTTGEPDTTSTTTSETTGTTGAPLDPPTSLDDILDGELELIADGHMFTEGPVWSPDGHLLYSDIPANTIFKWVEGGPSEPFITPSGNSNGLAFDLQGRLLAAEHGNRRLSRRVLGDDAESVADTFENKKLNSPNDLVLRSDGTIYFTDPPYGIQQNQQEQPVNGVYRVDPRGQLTRIADDFDRPNGIVLSPDESTLYVADTAKEHVRGFAVAPSGEVSGGDIFIDLDTDLPGNPDGMTIDVFGDLYVTGGGGVRIITPQAELLGTLMVPETVTNCTFGDLDGMSLFLTAQSKVYRIRLKVPGLGF